LLGAWSRCGIQRWISGQVRAERVERSVPARSSWNDQHRRPVRSGEGERRFKCISGRRRGYGDEFWLAPWWRCALSRYAVVGAAPVLVLHLERLPMNVRRLLDALQAGQQVQAVAKVATPISASQNTDADHVASVIALTEGALRGGSAKRWLRKFAQGAKWNFCLTADTIGPLIRREHEAKTTPEPHTGIQGEGGTCRHQGRPDACAVS
jgi:hypothetical protein